MPLLGTTYSHRHSAYLRLDPHKAITDILSLRFTYLRLGCYWDEIEKVRGRYDFSAIGALLKECEKVNQQVVLTVGMKAPRWPEYYFPDWLNDKTPQGASPYLLPFITECITKLSSYRCITHWQVENEPLDPSGPRELSISPSMLHKEVSWVKKLDSRPVVINLWGNELSKRKQLPVVIRFADIVGWDIYYKVPVLASFYRGPKDSDAGFRKLLEESVKPIWITELQAEPWERNKPDANEKTPSMNETLLRKNYERVCAFQPEAIFFWGSEYWLMQKAKGDDRLWKMVNDMVKHEASVKL